MIIQLSTAKERNIFSSHILPFDQLPTITESMPYRIDEKGNLLIFDIKEQMITLSDLIKAISDYQSLVITIYGGYRLFLPIYSKEGLSLPLMKEDVEDFYNFTKLWVGCDDSVSTMSSIYLPTPSKEIYYSETNHLLIFEDLYHHMNFRRMNTGGVI